uniref:Uncharacterized protein n=1 Tax=Octopus bimaculoides TaxID=37653 RepID=A0A0L8GV51_OCTBM
MVTTRTPLTITPPQRQQHSSITINVTNITAVATNMITVCKITTVIITLITTMTTTCTTTKGNTYARIIRTSTTTLNSGYYYKNHTTNYTNSTNIKISLSPSITLNNIHRYALYHQITTIGFTIIITTNTTTTTYTAFIIIIIIFPINNNNNNTNNSSKDNISSETCTIPQRFRNCHVSFH